MSPKSLRGQGKSTKKKTPHQRQQEATKRVHQTKFPRESEVSTNDTRDTQDMSPLDTSRKQGRR